MAVNGQGYTIGTVDPAAVEAFAASCKGATAAQIRQAIAMMVPLAVVGSMRPTPVFNGKPISRETVAATIETLRALL